MLDNFTYRLWTACPHFTYEHLRSNFLFNDAYFRFFAGVCRIKFFCYPARYRICWIAEKYPARFRVLLNQLLLYKVQASFMVK
jgi:hypothetical protein